MSDTKGDFPTTIGADAVFKGQLQFEKGVRLLGRFEGEIDSGGELVIAQGANLTGEVKAGSIRIDGTVKGNLSAETKMQLSGSARLEGDIQTAKLEVAEGAVLVGRVSVGVNGQHKPGEVKSASAASVGQPPAKPKDAPMPQQQQPIKK
jgi:cytoskeletal protein CcmA (bactofilin family)